MDTIFGIPMTGAMIALVVLLGLCLGAVGWIAWRRPVIFKLGVRNIPRRRAQTTLIVVGLMLSTLITSAALGTGDTLDHSVTATTYDVLGRVDEVVVYSQGPDGRFETALSTKIDAAALTAVEQAVKDDPRVAGVMPVLFEVVPAVNPARGQSEPSVILAGIDAAHADAFGGLVARDGAPINLGALPANGVVVSEKAAAKLDAQPGDALTVFYGNQPIALTVAAVARDSVMSGVLGSTALGMTMPLDRLQQVTGQPGAVSLVFVANAGGVRGGLAHSDAVTTELKAALAGQRLGVDPIKRDLIDAAEAAGATFTDLFLIFGLFSIAAGILLIVLIFAMLAAERRAEMGMERAVGTQRRQFTPSHDRSLIHI
jgi:putative ABC transport system permease protein